MLFIIVFFTFLFRAIIVGGYSSLLSSSPNRRFSYAGTYRKSNSVESSRVFSAYPGIDECFGIDDYFLESDGEEADDEFDQITNSADLDDRTQHSHLPLPHRVIVFFCS